jgi:YfiH family protein
MNLHYVQQVHGADVVEVDADTLPHATASVQADALIGDCPGAACCVRTADCLPLLLADPICGRVAAVHAGWRGIVAGVVPRTIARMSSLGSNSEKLLAAIGPHIRLPSFEVSEDVAQTIAQVAPGKSVIHRNFGPLPHVSLADCVTEQLRVAGVLPSNVDDVGGCTFSDASRFFSFRRQGASSGRHLHAIVPRRRAN